MSSDGWVTHFASVDRSKDSTFCAPIFRHYPEPRSTKNFQNVALAIVLQVAEMWFPTDQFYLDDFSPIPARLPAPGADGEAGIGAVHLGAELLTP
jgi:hypothetical protein